MEIESVDRASIKKEFFNKIGSKRCPAWWVPVLVWQMSPWADVRRLARRGGGCSGIGMSPDGCSRRPGAGRRSRSEGAARHFTGDEICLADRKCHDRERGVFRRTGRELRPVRYEEVRDVMALPVAVDHTVPRLG